MYPPEDARLLDEDGNNLLYAFIDGLAYEMSTVDAYDTLRSLLCLIPGGVLAANVDGETPFDRLVKLCPENIFAQSPPSSVDRGSDLAPRQIEAEARKEALLAFFGPRG